MRRVNIVFGLCVALICAAAVAAYARPPYIVVNMKATPQPLVDATIQDADIAQVLTALFNATNGAYQVQIAAGVTGNINDLKFTQKPFDEAVQSILAKVDKEYTSTKVDARTYKVSNPKGIGELTSIETESQELSTVERDGVKILRAKLPPIVQGQPIANATGFGAAAPTAVDCFLALITIKNVSVEQLASEFGYKTIPTFTDDDYSNGNSSSNGNRSNKRNSNNRNSNNNNNNNSRNNNNRNNNYNGSNNYR